MPCRRTRGRPAGWSTCRRLVGGDAESSTNVGAAVRHAPVDQLASWRRELDHATNERLLGENNLLPGIGIDELVFGVPNYHIVNASFCHAYPLGSRFNGPDRGAWYASFAIDTAFAEVAFHKAIELAEVNWFQEFCTYDDYLADFSAEFHDIRDDLGFSACLAADSYYASQELGGRLLDEGSLGIVYPSVRHEEGTCLACFRPALVANVRRASTYRFTWDGTSTPSIEQVDRAGLTPPGALAVYRT
jgi:RES domain-containing protein